MDVRTLDRTGNRGRALRLRRRRCRVCGFGEIATDRVDGADPIDLFECPRCEHRFTVPASPVEVSPQWPSPARVSPRDPEEVPSAA